MFNNGLKFHDCVSRSNSFRVYRFSANIIEKNFVFEKTNLHYSCKKVVKYSVMNLFRTLLFYR